jgi:flavin-dependent dehydrogenase
VNRSTAGGYDVVVVGARCAGAPTAMLLARAGHRVLLLDRARFPSDTISTHHVRWPGLARLSGWGVLDKLLATGCPPLERLVYRVDDVELAGAIPLVDGIRAACAPRRYILDRLLVEAAVDAGAEFRDGHSVVALDRRPGGPTTVHVRSRDNGVRSVTARLVVGADGMRSKVAGLVGAPKQAEHPRLTCAYYGYWEGLPADFEIFERHGRLVGAVPTHDGRTLVATYFPHHEFAAIRPDPPAAYLAAIRSVAPDLAHRMSGARQVERLRGTDSQWNVIRRAGNTDWALVGDAACTKDSINGTGITDAFEQADLLAGCVADALDSPRSLAEALHGYAVRHRAAVEDSYRAALISARLETSEQRLARVRWIASDPRSTALFVATGVGVAASTPAALAGSFRAGTT